jgi:hypothetical protein
MRRRDFSDMTAICAAKTAPFTAIGGKVGMS